MKFQVFILLFSVLMLLTVTFALPSYASGNDPYDSGYDHGCDDAGISDSSERYINRPEKGPAFHTDAFMNGYYFGFNACSGSDRGGTGDSDDDRDATQQQQVQASDDRQANPSDDAVTAGWKEGKNDYLNGDAKEYSCPSSRPDTYCNLYRIGYDQGWNAQINLGRGYGSEPQ
jgi:hypothetical protein